MKELFKNAIVNNIGRLIAGVLFTAVLGAITSVLIDPIMKVVDLPNQVTEWQIKTNSNLQGIEQSQKQFLNSVKKQTETDSVIELELKKLHHSHQLLQKEVGIVKAKLGTIKEEIPALHQRFNDIEKTVKYAQSYNEFASNYSIRKDSFCLWNKVRVQTAFNHHLILNKNE